MTKARRKTTDSVSRPKRIHITASPRTSDAAHFQDLGQIDWSGEVALLKSRSHHSMDEACEALASAVVDRLGLSQQERAFIVDVIKSNDALAALITRQLL